MWRPTCFSRSRACSCESEFPILSTDTFTIIFRPGVYCLPLGWSGRERSREEERAGAEQAQAGRGRHSFPGGGFISSNLLTALRLVPTTSARLDHLIEG